MGETACLSYSSRLPGHAGVDSFTVLPKVWEIKSTWSKNPSVHISRLASEKLRLNLLSSQINCGLSYMFIPPISYFVFCYIS